MGDMADYFLDGLWSDDCESPYIPSGYPKEKACRYCKARGLFWTHTEQGWRLADNKGNVHECPQWAEQNREMRLIDKPLSVPNKTPKKELWGF